MTKPFYWIVLGSWIILGVITFIFLGLSYLDTKPLEDQEIRQQSEQLSREQIVCDYSSNQLVSRDAVLKNKIGICQCLENLEIKDQCEKAVMDAGFYFEAIAQYDDSLCNNILDQVKQTACQKVVKSGIDYLEKNDPEQLAQIYAQNSNEKAIKEYEELLENSPENIDNLTSLALVYAGQGLRIQEQGGDQGPYVNKALALIERAKEIDPENAEVYRVEGYIYEIKPDIFRAIRSYDQAIEVNSDYALAYAGRGHAKSMVGILEEALKDFEKAALLDEKNEHIFIYTNLCRLQSERDDLINQAVKNCEIAVNSEKASVIFRSEAAQALANIYLKNDQLSQARNYLLNAKTLTPNSINLYISFAKLNIVEKEYIEAEENIKLALELSSIKAIAYQILAYTLYQQGKFDQAIIQAEKGLSLVENDVSLLQPNKPVVKKDLYYTLANIYHFKEDNENELKYKALGDGVFE